MGTSGRDSGRVGLEPLRLGETVHQRILVAQPRHVRRQPDELAEIPNGILLRPAKPRPIEAEVLSGERGLNRRRRQGPLHERGQPQQRDARAEADDQARPRPIARAIGAAIASDHGHHPHDHAGEEYHAAGDRREIRSQRLEKLVRLDDADSAERAEHRRRQRRPRNRGDGEVGLAGDHQGGEQDARRNHERPPDRGHPLREKQQRRDDDQQRADVRRQRGEKQLQALACRSGRLHEVPEHESGHAEQDQELPDLGNRMRAQGQHCINACMIDSP